MIIGYQSKGRRPTIWHFNYDLVGCDPDITLAPLNRSHRAAVDRNPATAVKNQQSHAERFGTAVADDLNRSRNTRQPHPCDCKKGFEGFKEGGSSLMPSSQDHEVSKLQAPVPIPSKLGTAVGQATERLGINADLRAHLEAGVFRKKIESAYFDSARSGMKPDECIREAIHEAVLSLLGNRSVELRGLNQTDLEVNTWKRLRNGNGLEALCLVKDFEVRSKQVVAVVTRCVTDTAFEFWKRVREVNSASG